MDKWSRNARIYSMLIGMGLYVSPIPSKSDPEKIEGLYVSSELPIEQSAKDAAVTGVVLTVERPEIGNVITPAEDSGNGVVVHFPTVR